MFRPVPPFREWCPQTASPVYSGQARSMKARLRSHPRLYEIHTLAWLAELSEKTGQAVNLATVPAAEWDRIERLGFDLVWLMGVWRRSPRARQIAAEQVDLYPAYEQALPDWGPEDVAGSPYAVYDYNPDPSVGDWSTLEAARKALHARGLGLILDLVPNHTALDHPWVDSDPEIYIQGSLEDYRRDPAGFFPLRRQGKTYFLARGRDPYFPPWTETLQLNPFHPRGRRLLVDTVRRLARYCDGFRCDMAMLVLREVFAQTWNGYVPKPLPAGEFWPEAIAAAPHHIWIAEAYWNLEERLQELGFDYTYDKPWYDLLLGESWKPLRRHLQRPLDYQSRSVRFLENHDEARALEAFGARRAEVCAALLLTLPGMKLVYQGQLEGRRKRFPVQLIRRGHETEVPGLMRFYEHLLALTDADCFHSGTWQLLPVSAAEEQAPGLLAYFWSSRHECRLVVLNLQGSGIQGRVELPPEVPRIESFREELHGGDFIEPTSGGFQVTLQAYSACIFSSPDKPSSHRGP